MGDETVTNLKRELELAKDSVDDLRVQHSSAIREQRMAIDNEIHARKLWREAVSYRSMIRDRLNKVYDDLAKAEELES